MFTKLDLQSAYNLICIKVGDEWKTVFSTSTGHYQYRVMPYGIAFTPSVFQCMINDMLRNMFGWLVIAYIDDILIYSPSYEQHVEHVKQVLSRLHEHQLYVKGKKCEFQVKTVTYLGYMISQGEDMDESKVKLVK